MVGLQPRAIMRAHVGGGVVHVNGEEQGSVVGIGAEVDQLFGQIEAVVDDGDDGRGGAIGVGQLGISAALDQGLGNVLVPVTNREHQRGEATGRMVRVFALCD